MFYPFLIILQIFFAQPSKSFEGIIKYSIPNSTDSLIYYIRKDKIRIHRKGDFVAKYGNYTDEFMDLENNQTALYNVKKGEYNFITHSAKKIPLEKIVDSTVVLSESCQGYLMDYGEIAYGGKMRDKLYISDKLYFETPQDCTIQSPMIINGSGKIALKKIRIVEGINGDYGETVLEAVEIIPMKISDNLLLF